MSEPSTRRAAERIDRMGRDCKDGRILRKLMLSEIASHVGFDAYVWVLTDPETEVGSDPLAAVPSALELPRLIRLKYSTPVNRWTSLVAPPVACLHAATEGRLAQSLVWRELWAGYGVTDVASVAFRDRFGCWAFLDLWRTGATRPFTRRDVDYLASIAPKVTARLRRVQALTFQAAQAEPDRHGPMVLVLSPELEVRGQTGDTDAYLRALVPPDGDGQPVPAGAYNVGAQLIAREGGVDSHPPQARVYLRSGKWLSLSAARLAGRDPATGDIAVTIEPASTLERMDLFARAHGLSRRESELLVALSRGSDTRHLAAELFVSENTIQDHLKAIFEKTGVRTRGALLARAIGA